MFENWRRRSQEKRDEFVVLISELEQLVRRANDIEQRLLTLITVAPSGDERRRYIRIVCDLPADVECKGVVSRGKIIDVGRGGIAVQGSVPVESGDIATVEAMLADSHLPLRLRGRVGWIAKMRGGTSKFGLAFISENEADETAVRRLVVGVVRNQVRSEAGLLDQLSRKTGT